jgi:hypothetical protein
MSVKVTFTWSENIGEGNMSRTDRARILELAKADWIVAADFMQDVIHYAQELYDEIMDVLPDSDMVTQAGEKAND